MKKETRIFITLFIILLASDIIFVGINYLSGKRSLQNNFKQSAEKIQASYDQAIAATEIQMLQAATYTAADTELQNLFLAGKLAVEKEGGGPGGPEAKKIRARLYNQVRESRDAIAAEFDFRQLHFHLGPGSLSFLRAHCPEKFGDRMDHVRHTVVTVNKSHKAVSGFETGRLISGIRGVVPVYAVDGNSGDKIFVGALEAGTSFKVTINKLAERQNIEIAVLLTLDHLKQNVWSKFIDKLSENNPPISGYFIEETTDPYISELLRNGVVESPGINEQKVAQLEYNHNAYCVASFPLRDFIGSIVPARPNVGVIVAWWNVQSQVDEFWTNQKVNIIYGILGFILIEILLFIGLRLSTKKLRQLVDQANIKIMERESLLKEAQHIGKIGHWEFTFKTDKLDWSDEVYRIFDLQPQNFKATYEAFLDRIHPDDRKKVDKVFKDSVAERSDYQIEHRILLENETEKWVLEKGYTEYNEAGEPIRSIGTVQDITELKLLRGIIPICCYCKKVRDDDGYYQQIEAYINKHSDADFSHTICPACMEE
ncbi:MAG: PAS domain-containing protein, partial [Pseudomonadota bacterium]|nr:PAS domain-containing protein [Pseudomonadota bacterium]